MGFGPGASSMSTRCPSIVAATGLTRSTSWVISYGIVLKPYVNGCRSWLDSGSCRSTKTRMLMTMMSSVIGARRPPGSFWSPSGNTSQAWARNRARNCRVRSSRGASRTCSGGPTSANSPASMK